jgi:hypothetical protein
MSYDLRPTEKYPQLTDERLSLIAQALRDVRDETLAMYDPLGGDNGWSHGCRAYVRSMFRIRQLEREYQWLGIISEEPRLRFTFAIEGIPIRFYRGSPDDPPGNYLVTTYGELQQRQLFEGLRPLDRILRLAVETDREGRVSTVKLVELDEGGEATGVYVIPFGAARSKVSPLAAKPINIEAPSVEPLHDGSERQGEQEKKRRL